MVVKAVRAHPRARLQSHLKLARRLTDHRIGKVERLTNLADRSRRPDWCPHRASPDVQAAVCELRRAHTRWSARRVEFETHQISARI